MDIGLVVLAVVVFVMLVGMAFIAQRVTDLRRDVKDIVDRLDTVRQQYYDMSERLHMANMKMNKLGRAMEMEWHEPPDPPAPAPDWRRKETT